MQEKTRGGLFGRLSKTRENLTSGLSGLFKRGVKLDESLYEEIEDQLIMSDIGVEPAQRITQALRDNAKAEKPQSADALLATLTAQISELLEPVEQTIDTRTHKPYVILMVGVNGVGKTTTIAKLANRFKNEGKNVMLAAGDTFRAAAIEQLQTWGARLAIPVIAQQHGSDAAAVAFDAYQAALSRNIDVLLIDTAGRQHTHGDLMEQLAKMTRVLQKANTELPHEVMLTVDAATGQNALSQIEHFKSIVGVSSLSVTKLDGTAKGGIIIAMAEKFGLPIRFIGVGESMQDLQPFVAQDFARALLPDSLGSEYPGADS
ncbi:MAG: signal recognition particle-docking protein FtsY [Proteobacteria bacterium]|nr:signal recognition particle-docking protein FtsY [Pseudomonadota bacterium]